MNLKLYYCVSMAMQCVMTHKNESNEFDAMITISMAWFLGTYTSTNFQDVSNNKLLVYVY